MVVDSAIENLKIFVFIKFIDIVLIQPGQNPRFINSSFESSFIRYDPSLLIVPNYSQR